MSIDEVKDIQDKPSRRPVDNQASQIGHAEIAIQLTRIGDILQGISIALEEIAVKSNH